ncbi:type VII secretion protein EccCa [Leucobacter albus]|uniref:Type VII secretion protein EccCa n=2 Tax=Leucobacter albus TaxID=272210 RepID=A0ABW3TRR5_9MICO
MSSRLAPPRVPSGTLSVQPPPELEAADGGGGILTSMLPMLGSVGAIIMVSVSNSGPTGWLTGGMFLISALGFVFVNGWRQRSQRQAQLMSSRREYLAYLAELRTTVRNGARAQRRERNWRYPDPGTLSYLVEDSTRVWERDPSSEDHLTARLGVNDQPLVFTLEAPEIPPAAQLDPVAATAAHRFIATHAMQAGLPTYLRIPGYEALEIVGEDLDRVRGLARGIITHLATMQSPEDLLIVIAAGPNELPHWEWAKWLPHVQSPRLRDSLGPARMIGADTTTLLSMLPTEVRERPRFVRDAPVEGQQVLVVVDGARVASGDAVFGGGLQGVTVLELPQEWDESDNPNRGRLALYDGGADLLEGSRRLFHFTPDNMSVIEAEAVARRLAPLHSVEGGGQVAKTGSNRQQELIDLLRMPDVRDLDFAQTWRYLPERDRLRVPIGQDTSGAPLILDLKESASQGMGPHGLIIGATGSGKSEVLRTLVLSLALTHSPEQLNFVLIDFKGGATFAGMADMPHVSAIITNLGDEISLVDRMEDALLGEMTRRQELLRAAGNFVNVGEYEKARKNGRDDLPPLPALLIVADEFSELLSAKPEFIETFVAIGRLGRSLHVHLLMASQRLEESKLKGLDTHLSYRVGLRTFSAAESRSVIGVPDAYHLPQEPGGGLLKVGSDEHLTQFRAAYVSGPPPARRAKVEAIDGGGSATAHIVPFTAAAHGLVDPAAEAASANAEAEQRAAERAAAEPEETRSTFDLAVSRMAGHGPAAHQVWLPPLEDPASLDQLLGELSVSYELGLHAPRWREHRRLTVPLGIVDVPLQQRRDTLALDLSGAQGNLAIVGAPLSGKSTAARSLLAALALTHTPHEVQAFVIDFGGSFAGLTGLPHLAGLATRSEPEVIRRTVAEVTSLLNAREGFFRAHGIDSIDTYRSRRAQGLVDDGYGDIFLIVDGYGTLRNDYETLDLALQEIAARGLGLGVHLVVTANRWLEIRPALKDLLGGKVELRLGDSADSEISRKAAGNVTALPGRGLDQSGLQMLIAVPRIDGVGSSEALAEGVEDLVAKISSAWQREPGPKLRLLPSVLPLEELREHPAAAPGELLLGLDEAALAPVGIDPATESHLFLYGDSGSGKSSMLRGLAHEIARHYAEGDARIFMIDYRRAHLGEIPEAYLGAYLTSAEQATAAIAELVEFFRGRLPGPEVTTEQLRNRSWWSGAEGFVMIDDYDLVATQQGNPAAPLAQLLAQASDVGLHVFVTRRSGGASRAAYDPILQGMTDLGVTGILLSGSPDEGQLIGKVKAVPSIPGRAQIVSRARGHQVAQLAYVPSAHEGE